MTNVTEINAEHEIRCAHGFREVSVDGMSLGRVDFTGLIHLLATELCLI